MDKFLVDDTGNEVANLAAMTDGDAVFMGDVGIGTTSPSGKLSVYMEDADYGGVTISGENFNAFGDSATRFGIIDRTGAQAWFLSANNDGNFAIYQGGVGDRLTIDDSTGNVGIGTMSPGSYRLNVNATSGTGPAIYGVSTNSLGLYGNSSNSYGIYGTSTNSYGVYGNSGSSYAGYFNGNVHVTGILTVGGAPKSFVQPHPENPEKEVVYVAFEGRDVRIFFDGTAKLKNGKALIEVPEDFKLAASADKPLNVMLTPFGDAQLYVKKRSLNEIIVKSRDNSDIEFGYLVIGTRAGYEEFKPIQENTHFRLDKQISIKEFEQRFAVRDTDNHYSKAGKKLNRDLLIQSGILTKEGKVDMELIKSLGWEYKEEDEEMEYAIGGEL